MLIVTLLVFRVLKFCSLKFTPSLYNILLRLPNGSEIVMRVLSLFLRNVFLAAMLVVIDPFVRPCAFTLFA